LLLKQEWEALGCLENHAWNWRETLLEIHISRLKKCKEADAILIATTLSDKDAKVVEMANKFNVLSFRGSENDVLDRFYQATKPFNPEWVVRVTSDCP